jgi:hypothetical protein
MTAPLTGSTSVTVTLPDSVELCVRLREGQPCLGIVYRPQPGIWYCHRCGGHAPGVFYDRRGSNAGHRLPRRGNVGGPRG